jgi:hypothetical protein
MIRWLTNGLVSSLLIMIGMAGAFYTIKTGHFGAITIAAIAAFVLFFGGQYITSVAPFIAIVLFLAGITLLLIEVSPVPTFGFAGVLGILGVTIGLFLALAGDLRALTPERMAQTFVTLAIALSGVVVLGFLIIKYGPKSTWLKKFRNEATTADTGFYAREAAEIVGLQGISQTMLRPAGIVMIGDRKIDAVTSGEFLPPGTPVTITSVRGNRAVVEAIETLAAGVAGEQIAGETPAPRKAEVHQQGDAFGGISRRDRNRMLSGFERAIKGGLHNLSKLVDDLNGNLASLGERELGLRFRTRRIRVHLHREVAQHVLRANAEGEIRNGIGPEAF